MCELQSRPRAGLDRRFQTRRVWPSGAKAPSGQTRLVWNRRSSPCPRSGLYIYFPAQVHITFSVIRPLTNSATMQSSNCRTTFQDNELGRDRASFSMRGWWRSHSELPCFCRRDNFACLVKHRLVVPLANFSSQVQKVRTPQCNTITFSFFF